MKKYFLGLISLVFVGCASTQELKQSSSCKVWKNQPLIGPQSYQVNNDSVDVKTSCMFLFWGCSFRRTDIDSQGAIYHKGAGMFSSRTKIASLQGSEIVYERSIFDSLASVDPVRIDMEKKTAYRKVNSQLLGMSGEEMVEFNSSCQLRQAAVGAVAFWVNANKKN